MSLGNILVNPYVSLLFIDFNDGARLRVNGKASVLENASLKEPFPQAECVTLHGLIVMVGLAIYVITSHTLHLRPHPSAAIAWVVALVLLPYVALPLYLMFGSRKVESYLTTPLTCTCVN